MWCDVMWCDVMWCNVMWCDVMWCDVMWCDVMWCDVMWCDVMWCDVWYVIPNDVWYAIPCVEVGLKWPLISTCATQRPSYAGQDHFSFGYFQVVVMFVFGCFIMLFFEPCPHQTSLWSWAGPKDVTLDHFWQMVWQENCSSIVMLTGLVETKKVSGWARRLSYTHWDIQKKHRKGPFTHAFFHGISRRFWCDFAYKTSPSLPRTGF